MNRVRLTYEGAYHHIMNKGIKGENILPDDYSKKYFLDLLEDKSKKLKIKNIAYCIMDNHYHLIIKNFEKAKGVKIKEVNINSKNMLLTLKLGCPAAGHF